MKTSYALLACLMVSPVARAEITATFVQDEAIFGVGNNTWALQVTTDTDWLTGEIDIQLDSGTLGNVPAGPSNIIQPYFDTVEDSGVFGDNFATPIIAPDFVNTATEFSASWDTTASDEVGTFYIGAFTFSPDATGTIAGRVTAVNPKDRIDPLVFDLEGWSVVHGEVIQSRVPEPSTIVMVGVGMAGVSLAFRRK